MITTQCMQVLELSDNCIASLAMCISKISTHPYTDTSYQLWATFHHGHGSWSMGTYINNSAQFDDLSIVLIHVSAVIFACLHAVTSVPTGIQTLRLGTART